MKDLLEPVKPDYDFVLIDTPPTMSDFTRNAAYASDYIIMAFQTQSDSLDGVEDYISEEVTPLVEKFDCKKQNSSFMNYYKRTMHNDIILAYDKHRETNEKTREEIKKRIKTMASLDYLINISADDEVPVYALV